MAWMTPEPGYRPRRGEPLVPYVPDEDDSASTEQASLPQPSLPRVVAVTDDSTRPAAPLVASGNDADEAAADGGITHGTSAEVAQRQPASDVDLVFETPSRATGPRPRPASVRQAAVASRTTPVRSRNLLPYLAGLLLVVVAYVVWRGVGDTAPADDGPYPAGVPGVWERVTPDFEGQYLVLTADSVVVPATLQRNTGTFPVLEVTSSEAGREIAVVVRFRGPSGEETLEFLVDTPPVTVLRFRQPEGMLWKRVKAPAP